MRIRTSTGWTIALFLALAFLSSVGLGSDTVDKAQAATAEAEKNLQRAIDADPKVLAARRKVARTQAALDAAINSSPEILKAAAKRYEEAQADEARAVESAAPAERAILARRQKDLLAAQAADSNKAGDAKKGGDSKQKEDAIVVPTARAGDVEVSLLQVRIGPVSYSGKGSAIRLSEPFLSILVYVRNAGKEPVSYTGWNTTAFASDSADKQYLPAGIVGGTILGRVVQANLPAGASIRDLIVLQKPPEGKELTITLPAFNVGGSGAIQFHVAGDKIEVSKDPLIDRNTPPTVVFQPVMGVPSSQPNVSAGNAGHSVDGVDFPAVSDPAVKAGKARPVQRLPDVCKLLQFPPAKLNLPIFNVEKSGWKLASRMSHEVDVPGARARGVTRVTRIEVDHLDPACKWFALNVANADVAGFEVRNGIVARIVLYYRRSDTVQRMLMMTYGQAPQPNASPTGQAVECGPWSCQNSTSGSKRDAVLKRDIWAVLPQESPATIEVDVAAASTFEQSAPPRPAGH